MCTVRACNTVIVKLINRKAVKKKLVFIVEIFNIVRLDILVLEDQQYYHRGCNILFLGFLQVIAAVGFTDCRLEIPNDIDPQWASIIERCWHRCEFLKLCHTSYFSFILD